MSKIKRRRRKLRRKLIKLGLQEREILCAPIKDGSVSFLDALADESIMKKEGPKIIEITGDEFEEIINRYIKKLNHG